MINACVIKSSYFDVKISHMNESSTYFNRIFNYVADENNVQQITVIFMTVKYKLLQ